MNVVIKVECDTIDDLLSHLDHMKEQVIRSAKRRGLMLTRSELPVGVVLKGDNCYGVHELRTVKEETATT